MNSIEIAFSLASPLCSTAGQILFKAAAVKNFSRAIPFWAGGMFFMLASMLAATIVLRTTPLSALVPFAALAYITTPLAAMLVFKETVKKHFWLGSLCIIAGVMLTLA